jgi:hypothetical protein
MSLTNMAATGSGVLSVLERYNPATNKQTARQNTRQAAGSSTLLEACVGSAGEQMTHLHTAVVHRQACRSNFWQCNRELSKQTDAPGGTSLQGYGPRLKQTCASHGTNPSKELAKEAS